MSFWRRHRWTRRTLLGLAFAVMAAPAAAQPLESSSSELGLQPQETTPQVIPYLSHGIGVSAADFAGQPQATPQVIPYVAHGMGVSAEDYAGQAQAQSTTYVSPDILGEAMKSQTSAPVIPDVFERTVAAELQTSAPVIPDVFERMVAAELRTVDPITGIPLSAGIPQPGDPFVVVPTTVRPDDRSDRFVVGDGTPAPATTADDGFALDWENGVTVGLGGLAIVLALALALSYTRRPRIAL